MAGLDVLQIAMMFASAVVVIVTLLPFSGSHAWWVRGWDFPRVQIGICAAVLLLLSPWVLSGVEAALFATALALCGGYQAYRIFPYTPLAKPEVGLAEPEASNDIIRVMSVNVMMENDNYAGLMHEVARAAPDVLLMMETDQMWIDAVEPMLGEYETVIRVPLDNHYGMAFATRLKVIKAEAVYLVDDDTPAMFAELMSVSGDVMRFVGLHPRPPVPGNETKERDAQILFAARFARDSDTPLIAMGDFNDAAWSDTAHHFKMMGEYLDPRIGRGLFASFDARSRLLRCPIDHFYHTKEVAVVDFGLGQAFGSDHFPITASICLDRRLAAKMNSTPPKLGEGELERANQIVTERTRSLGDLFEKS